MTAADQAQTPQNKTQEWLNRIRANPKIPLMVAGAAAIAIVMALVLRQSGHNLLTF